MSVDPLHLKLYWRSRSFILNMLKSFPQVDAVGRYCIYNAAVMKHLNLQVRVK